VRPAPLRFEDEVPEDALPVVMRDAIAPAQAVAVRVAVHVFWAQRRRG
jgi:hypothetical protein